MASGTNLIFCRVNLGLRRRFLLSLLLTLVTSVASAGNKPAWIELRSPNFIVVTNASEGQARQTAYQFEIIRGVFRQHFGMTQETTEQPLMILAAKDENTLKQLLPEHWAQKGSAHPAGIYLGGADADYIALRLDVSLDEKAYEPFEPVYHEYVHYLTRQTIARLPLWMVEGMAEFYGNTRISNKIVYLGAPSATNVFILRHEKVLPVSTLFEIDASSPYYHEQNKTSIFYAESWALTYYLITRDWKEKKHLANDFVQLLNKGVAAKEAAAQTIGDVKTLDDALRAYIRNFSVAVVKIEPPKIDESGFRVRSLADAEALAVRADFMAHDRHYSEAQQMLEQALKADPKLGIAYDGLSFLALQQGDFAEAEKWSSQALALDPQNYRANYYYAWSLLNAGRTDEASLGKAESSLRAVIKANPEFVHAYDALAFVLTLEGGKEKLDEAYMMTLQAVSREPGNVQYRVRSVEVLERQRRAKDAVRVATLAVEMAHTPEERQAAAAALAGAQQFEESWEKIEAIRAGRAALGDKAGAGEVLPTGALRVTRAINMSAQALLLTNTQGVDFNAYLTSEVMAKIQREWLAEMQKLKMAAPDKKATVIFEFAIAKDGSIAEMKLKQATEDPDLDDALQGAIQAAGPFAPLPARFRGKQIALRVQFDYDPAPAPTTQDAASDSTK